MKKRQAKKILKQQETRPAKPHQVHEAAASIQRALKRAEKSQ